MKRLLTLTAILEAQTGLALLVVPSFVARLLLGTTLEAPAALTVARVAGAALLALALACWLARENGRALVAAMLIYNIGAVAILAHAGLGLALSGIGLWPAVILHIALGGWCAACLRPSSSHNLTFPNR